MGAANNEILDFETWSTLARPIFNVRAEGEPRSFAARASSERRGKLIVTNVAFSPTEFVHDPNRIREFDNDYLMFERYDTGINRGQVGDVETRLCAGSMHVIDMSRPYRTLTSAVSGCSVLIPHATIGYEPGRHACYARSARSTFRGLALDAALTALLSPPNTLASGDHEALASVFTNLLRRLLLGLPDSEADGLLTRGRKLLLESSIEARLAEPGLNPSRLCSDFGLSRATLYRMFEAHGGVRRYIFERRLERCRLELLQGPRRRGRVREVSEKWFFFDSGNFNRCFRARHGMAPSDCLDEGTIATADAGDAAPKLPPFEDWLRKL